MYVYSSVLNQSLSCTWADSEELEGLSGRGFEGRNLLRLLLRHLGLPELGLGQRVLGLLANDGRLWREPVSGLAPVSLLALGALLVPGDRLLSGLARRVLRGDQLDRPGAAHAALDHGTAARLGEGASAGGGDQGRHGHHERERWARNPEAHRVHPFVEVRRSYFCGM